jgi:hypothetical protein
LFTLRWLQSIELRRRIRWSTPSATTQHQRQAHGREHAADHNQQV